MSSKLLSRINNVEADLQEVVLGKANTNNPTFNGVITFPEGSSIVLQSTNDITKIVGLNVNNVGGLTGSLNSKLSIENFNSTMSTEFYTKTGTNKLITDLIDTAPASLNTLKELAVAVNNDPNYATNIANLIYKKDGTTTNINTNTQLNIGLLDGSNNLSDIAKFSDSNITFKPQLNITGGANLYNTFTVKDTNNNNTLLTVDPNIPLFDLNMPITGRNYLYNKTDIDNNFYTQTTCDTRFQEKLKFFVPPSLNSHFINQDDNQVKAIDVVEPIRLAGGSRTLTVSLDPDAYYRRETVNSLLTSDSITDRSNLASLKTLTTSLSIIQTSLNDKFSSTNKPNIADVNGLQSSLDSKFSSTNKPTIDDVVNLGNELSNYFSTGRLPIISQIVGLQGALDLKFSSSNLPSISNVQGLTQSLGEKFSSSNLPSISNVQGLTQSLGEKFSSSNLPNISNVQGLTQSLGEKFSSSNKPSISMVDGLSELLGLGGGSTVNLSDYYKKGHIDTNFNLAFDNDLRLADRADQKFEFDISQSADANSSQILNIGSITYPRLSLGDGKMTTIKIYLSQDRALNYDFHLLINFKFTSTPLSVYEIIGETTIYSNFNCQYYIFSDGATYTYPKVHINQRTDVINDANGDPIEYRVFTFFLDISYNPFANTGKNLVLINGNAPFTVSNSKITRLNFNSNFRGVEISPCVVFNSKNKPSADDISQLDTYIWNRAPRMTIHDGWSDSTRFYSLGLFYLPQNGYVAKISLTACQGYGLTGGYKSTVQPSPQNYNCNIYIYSGNASADVPGVPGKWALSLALDEGSNSSGGIDKGCYHYGFYEVASMWAKPGAVYIAPYFADPMNYVSVWVQNTAYWGRPLIEVSTNGLYYRDGFLLVSTALPNTGWIRLRNRYENFVAIRT